MEQVLETAFVANLRCNGVATQISHVGDSHLLSKP